MLVRSLTYAAVVLLFLVPEALTQDLPSAQDVPLIEANASTWDLVLKREHLRAMTAEWRSLTADPDSASAYFNTMLPVANAIVDQLMLSTGLERGPLMRWLESDVGLKPYFFPPRPESRTERKRNGLWKILAPLVPVIVYRVVDRVLD